MNRASIADNDYLISSMLVLASVVEAKDPYTGGHCWRVGQFSRLIAAKMNMSDYDIVRATLGGYVHDIGKIATPDHILQKPGKLTRDEFKYIELHPVVGHQLLSAYPAHYLVERVVLQHHERMDGTGYPHGLSRDEISSLAKVVAVADSYDAMTSDRPYRKSLSQSYAREAIQKGANTQFCPEVAEAFTELSDQELSGIVQHSDWERPLQECPTCGFTIVIESSARTGHKTHCPVCKEEDEIAINADGTVVLTPTNRKAPVEYRTPIIDNKIVSDFVALSHHLD